MLATTGRQGDALPNESGFRLDLTWGRLYPPFGPASPRVSRTGDFVLLNRWPPTRALPVTPDD